MNSANLCQEGRTQVESHLSQVILVDREQCQCLHWGACGKRMVEICFMHALYQCDVLLAGVHFPHKNDSEDTFQAVLVELEGFFLRAKRHSMAFVAGDWDTQANDDRHNQILALASYNGFTCLAPDLDTWYRFGTSKRYDFAFYRDSPQHCMPAHTAAATCNIEATHELRTDQALVTISCHVLTPGLPDHQSRAHGKHSSRNKCSRWVVTGNVEAQLNSLLNAGVELDLQAQCALLTRLASEVCSRRASLKFVDPPFVKDLCNQRRMVGKLREASEPG